MIHLAVPLGQKRRRNCLRFSFVSPGAHTAAAAVIHDERDLKIYPLKNIVLYTSIITGWMLIIATEVVTFPLANSSRSALEVHPASYSALTEGKVAETSW
jgi:hypothetical protein